MILTKRFTLSLICLIIVFNLFATALDFTLIHTNDHHGNPFSYILRDMEIAGLAERSHIIKELLKNTSNFLILDAGDINTGKPESMLFDAKPDLIAYNLIGYHAMAIGNHEFYRGLERLEKQKQWANFPFLSANILYSENNSVGVPYIIKTLDNGLRIGIIGLTTTTIKRSVPNVAEKLIILDEVETAKKLVPEIKKKADIVIALTHLGIYPEYHTDYGSLRLANEVPEIDLIVDGHSHTEMNEAIIINNTPVIQAGDRGKFLGHGIFRFENNKLSVINWQLVPLSRRRDEPVFIADPVVADSLAFFKEIAFKQFNNIIAYSNEVYSVTNIRRELNSLGRLVCDAFLFSARNMNADFAITNGGGIRADLPKGNIRNFHVHDMLPFDNSIVIVRIKGKDIQEIVDFSMNKMRNTGGFLQFSSNVRIEYNSSKGTSEISINDIPLKENHIYRLAVSSYIASGGDNYSHFKNALSYDDIGITDKTALTEFLSEDTRFSVINE